MPSNGIFTAYEKEDYNFNTHRRQVTIQNTYFNERFGRCDMEPLRDRTEMGSAMAYIMKYIEKSGEKIVYSRGLPQYFISDILDDDVVCPIGMEDQKLLLFDNFSCFEDGVYIGEVSPEVINQMKKANYRGLSCQHSFTNQLRAGGKMRRLAKRLSGDLASVGA